MNRALIIVLIALAAVARPVELFLFAFIVLGPLHYFTEISWLQRRRCFVEGRTGGLLLTAIGVVGAATALIVENGSTLPVVLRAELQTIAVTAMFAAAVVSAALALAPRLGSAGAGGALFAASVSGLLITHSSHAREFFLVVGLWLPTLIHVFAFTGLFLVHGCLRRRTPSDRAALAAFAIAPVALAAWPGEAPGFSPAVAGVYEASFAFLNRAVLDLLGNADLARGEIFASATGVSVMRFLAFAYTYHFVNWFEKTARTGWHRVPPSRLATIGTAWMLSVALCLYDLPLGLAVLLLPNVLHVVLELPLDWRTARDVGASLTQPLLIETPPSTSIAVPVVKLEASDAR